MPDKSSTNLLDLPPEILTHIFTFICPKWHLNDIDIEPQRGQQHQRRYRAKLHMFQLPGYPAPKTPPAFASLRSICTTLRPIASRAIHDSFTGHAHISCNRTILMCPRPWMSVLHRVQTVSVDLSYCDVIFHEVHAPKLPNLQSMKLYCYRDYCWRPQPPGTSPACLDRMLETKEYDALFQSEAVKSVVDNSGHEFLRGLPPGLAELTWYQCFDFSDEWDGVLVSFLSYSISYAWHR